MELRDDEEIQMVVKALNHYYRYLVATDRTDERYKELAERLQRKGPAKEVPQRSDEKRKKG